MTNILSILLSVTRGAILTAALIGLVRLIFRKVLSAKAKYYLWLLLALRLMLPVVPASPVSLLNFIPEPGTITQTQPVSTAPAAPKSPTITEPNVAAPLQPAEIKTAADPAGIDTAPEAPSAPSVPSAPAAPKIPRTEILFWVWLSGAGLLLLIYGALYAVTAIRLKRFPVCTDSDTLRVFLELKRVLGIKGHVRLVSGGAGMLGGVFHSTIVLPVEQHGEDVTPIIVHELLHYKYRDLRLFVLFRLLAAVYWFNPVVWLLLHFAKLDCEAACDQRVLETKLVRPERYAGALYEEGVFSMKKNLLMQTTFGGSRHSLKRRIQGIAAFQSPKVWVTVLTVILAAGITACTMTGAQSSTEAVSSGVSAEDEKALTSSMEHSGETSDPVGSSLEDAADGLTFSPYVRSGDQLTFENTAWDMTFSEVVDAQALDMETWKSSDIGQPTIYLEQPISDHPEVERIAYTFHLKNPAVIKELIQVEIEYDPEQIDCETLIAQRTQELGEPEGTYENQTFWIFGDIQLAIYPGEHGLQERLMQYVDRSEELLPTQEQLDEFLVDIQPPNGHYGWTFEQHVEAGLLDPERGEMEPGGSSDANFQVFYTEIALGGYTVDAEYCFTETMANKGSGQMVLTEVHADPPDDIALSKWVAQFSQPWSDRMVRLPDSNQWNSPLVAGKLLTDNQRETIAQELLESGRVAVTMEQAYEYLDNWNMAMNFYEAARGWVFNGTGAALYAVAQTIP